MKDRNPLSDVMLERQDIYRTVNHNCGKVISIYDKSKHKVFDAGCKSLSCGRCRPTRVNILMNNVVRSAKHNNLTRHFTITLKGDQYRKYISPDGSFNDFSKKWNQFRKYFTRWFSRYRCPDGVIRFGYELEKYDFLKKECFLVEKVTLDYIAFRRAQTSGYCHLHGLTNRYINKSLLSKLADTVGLGNTRIDFVDVHRLKNYLSKYWYEEHEWFIPSGMRHITMSRSVKLSDGLSDDDLKREFNYRLNISVIPKLSGNDSPSYFERVVNHIDHICGYPPPFDFMMAEFVNKKYCEV